MAFSVLNIDIIKGTRKTQKNQNEQKKSNNIKWRRKIQNDAKKLTTSSWIAKDETMSFEKFDYSNVPSIGANRSQWYYFKQGMKVFVNL